jgi:hypothetical protein
MDNQIGWCMFTLAFACSHNHCIDLWVAECTIVVEFDLQDSSWFLGNFMFPKFSMNHKNGCKLDCIASEIEGLMFAKCSEDCTDIHWRKRQNLSRDMYWQVEPHSDTQCSGNKVKVFAKSPERNLKYILNDPNFCANLRLLLLIPFHFHQFHHNKPSLLWASKVLAKP